MKQSIRLLLRGMLVLAMPLMLTSCEDIFDDIFGEWSRPSQKTPDSTDPEKKPEEKTAATISYATASVSKTFGDADFINDLTNTGDGAVTYSSSDPAVATIDATTGLVSIKGNGITTITATVADGEKFTYATKTATYTLGVGTAAMTVTATGYTGTYDGAAHGITVTVATPDGATVKYGTAAGSYSLTASPTYTDAGSYTVYYEVTKAGYTTFTGSATVEIAKKAATISFAESSVSKTFGDADFTNKLTNSGDGAVTYESSNTAVAEVNASGLVSIKGNGDVTIKATVTDGKNYTYATKSVSFALGVGTPTMSVTATGYNDVYDGNAHGITVNVASPSGATIKYGETEGNYDKTSSPTYTDAGNYKVYYQVTKDGYTTFTGSATVVISKKAGTISFPSATSEHINDDNAFQIKATITGDGTITGYSSSNINVATVDKNGTVTIVSTGTAIITATAQDGKNYKYSPNSATYTLTVKGGGLNNPSKYGNGGDPF